MPRILAAGRTNIPTNGKEYGKVTVDVPGVNMDANDTVLLTVRPSRGNNPPEGLGPLYNETACVNDETA